MRDSAFPIFHFASRRSVVHGTRGVVATSQPLATQVGIEILKAGGNAADAAVAVAAALNVTEPCSTGIGGDMFCLFHSASDRSIRSLNGSGRSPKHGSLETLRKELGLKDGEIANIPITSVHSVTVPGAAAGWCDTVEKLGSGKLTMGEILEPAIRLAETGFPVTQTVAGAWERSEQRIKEASPNGFEILKPDSQAAGGFRAPRCGEIMRNPTLAQTFRILAKEGKKGFYEGKTAGSIIKATSSQGGHLTLDDLKQHEDAGTEETKPISLRFTSFDVNKARGGVDVWEHPPNGQGIVALLALGIVQELERSGKIKRWSLEQHNSVEYLHVLIEALRLGFADANQYLADPSVVPVPVEGLLSQKYLASRASLISVDKAIPKDSLSHGSPAEYAKSDTVYFTVVDGDGNAASFINSNYAGFGTAIVPPGGGFTLQNRGANFNLIPGHANAFAPSKRPYHTIIPAMLTHADNGELKTSFGVMGGFMQPQGHAQVFFNMEVFGMDPQEALDAPRFCIGEGMPGPDGKVVINSIYLEDGIDREVLEGLSKLGHPVKLVEGRSRALFGRGQIIIRSKDEASGLTVLSAGSDMRADGNAAAVA